VKKLKKKYSSSHKLPKQQTTSFWSQGILGVNVFDWYFKPKKTSAWHILSQNVHWCEHVG
jgi:hypothetical protein